MSTLSNNLLQKVFTLVTLIAIGTEIYVATMTNVLSDSYNSLVDTLNHMESLKLEDNLGRNVEYCCDEILLDVERLESSGAFKPEHLKYIIRIFEDTSNSRFHIWATQKYKEVMEFVKKICVCDEDVMQTDNIINYGFLVQEYLREYSNIFESKRWEPTGNKNTTKDEILLMMNSNM